MKQNTSMIMLAACLLIPIAAAAQWPEGSAGDASRARLSPALDTGYVLGLTQIEDSAFEDHGESGILVFDAEWAAAYFMDALFGGDVELDFVLAASFISDSTALDLPDQLLQLVADVAITWRYEGESELRATFAPGYYTDMKELGLDGMFFPFSLVFATPLSLKIAGVIGAQVRPEFERAVLPVVGVDWAISEHAELQLQLPQSQLTWYAARNLILYAALEWKSESFALEKDGAVDRKMITFESLDMEAGILFKLNDEMRIALVVGESSDREVEFEKDEGLPRVSDIEDGQFFKIAILGPF